MQPMAVGQLVGDVTGVYKCLTKEKLFGELSLDVSWEVMKWDENGKFSSETWRIGSWGEEEQTSCRVRLGAPEKASQGSCEIMAGARLPWCGDSTPARRAVPIVNSSVSAANTEWEACLKLYSNSSQGFVRKVIFATLEYLWMRIRSKGANGAGNRGRGSTGKVSWEYVPEKQANVPFLGWRHGALSDSSPWHFWWCTFNHSFHFLG